MTQSVSAMIGCGLLNCKHYSSSQNAKQLTMASCLSAKMCCLSSNGGLIEVELYSRQKITTPDASTTSSRSCRCARLDHFRCGGCNIHTCANYLHQGEKQTTGQLKQTKWGSCKSHLKSVSQQSWQIWKH